ncbi:MAG TPA: hypothetical protein VFU14_04040 [Acidimicrobiales bacterium]|nr:hypothetical protein [Acidimicrobiales bacterium]
MGRHLGRRAIALRALGAVGLLLGGWLAAVDPALAEPASSVDDIGWWSRANQDPAIGGALVVPDVSPGQLLVEGTPEGATAIAALRATLPEGTGSAVVTLRAASAVGAETAVLLACQAGSGWTGVHAGAWDAKPSPDCSQSVQGIPSEDGTEWTFAVAPLQFGDQLDLVLTPGRDPSSGEQLASAFRVVFERPTADAIEVAPVAGGVQRPVPMPTDPRTAPPGAPGGGASFTPGGSGTPSFSVPAPLPADALSSQPAQAALPPGEQGRTATAPSLTATQPVAAPPLETSSGEGRLLGVIVVLGAGALLYWSSQQPLPERRGLSRFAAAGAVSTVADVAPEPTVGGLGRFRRPRTAPARPLG